MREQNAWARSGRADEAARQRALRLNRVIGLTTMMVLGCGINSNRAAASAGHRAVNSPQCETTAMHRTVFTQSTAAWADTLWADNAHYLTS